MVKPKPSRTTPALAPGRAYRGLGAAQRVDARRLRLIEAGIELFGTLGFRATTVRKVCAQAGLTDRYFYESFAGLEALLDAVYRALMADLRLRLKRAAQLQRGAGIEARFTAGYDVWFKQVSDPRQARVLLSEVLGVSPAIDTLYQAAMQEFAAATAEPLAEAGASAERRALIGQALVGAAVQVARTWAASGYRASRRAVVRSCVLVGVGTVRALLAEKEEKDGKDGKARR
jgi:AcrR family transcriptional regulator